MDPKVECVVDGRCRLGEGPVWDERAACLWWVDIKAPAVHRFEPATGATRSWPAPDLVTALALRQGDGLLASLRRGFAFFDPQTGAFDPIPGPDPEPDHPENRFNDGKCDGRGRFWAGTMDDAERRPTGHLYRLDPDLTLTRFEAGFVVTNGPAFSRDGATFYFTDSGRRTILAHDFDLDVGTLSPPRVFARLAREDGFPDGACVDAEDHLWSACWDGGRLIRFRPDGTVAARVSIPAPRPTSCCFGGPALDELYVTSARIGLDSAALEAFPRSGGLFRITGLGFRGLPAARFGG